MRLVWALLVVTTAFCLTATAAQAYDETQPGYDSSGHPGTCARCHYPDIRNGASNCLMCHSLFGPGEGYGTYKGPHGGYVSVTDKCAICHSVHQAAGSLKLLPANTVKAVCETCHDSTNGRGVYGALAARGITPGARHRIDATATVPGGDPVTGGSRSTTFTGENGSLTCDDCHSPHDNKTVNAFYGDRLRSPDWPLPVYAVANSTKLLKRRPTGATTETAEYGSDWCMGCHSGRASGGQPHNHPVDSKIVTTTPFRYSTVAVLASDGPTGLTQMGQVGGRPSVRGSGNRGYLMPYPRTPEQSGHSPICQQCHEDSRDVGDLVGDGSQGQAVPSVITTPDGASASDNPRFQNFPHETENPNMTVETVDDLCLNCHPPN